MRNLLEDLELIVSLDDEVVDHDCPLHDDLSYDFESLNVYDRATLVIVCTEITVAEDIMRRAVHALADPATLPNQREFHGRQKRLAGARAKTSRRNAMRILQPDLVDDDGPLIDLWAS